MTREQFVERFRHELGGMILDALTPRDGAHAAMFVRLILRKVDTLLGAMYHELASAAAKGQQSHDSRTTSGMAPRLHGKGEG